ncbi:hypothetical protein WOLCODRAFT_123950 [Wolfiporia cocos MD-104 SS10]|uniref:Histone deacetylase interacting domain-containing protein n=1 Tax=Wolfiporia cocos (strain MD-104) TaxID=742152 RepID=A0A2H3K6J4_WOLCO|nr:hypothetical protein WOLCODRAFT_123950 [Wolfiporia cocos MD-104 SS10]
MKFIANPEVYNRFLDIMKDFKSQFIDTPGVIERVSNLFHGHPTLIQGFNTFLPAGYRIDCATDAQNPNYITVTTPAGTTTQATNGAFAYGSSSGNTSAQQVPAEGDDTPHISDVNLTPALEYLQRVKTRYANESDKYRRFLEIINPNSGPSAPVENATSEVRNLEHWAVAWLSAGYAHGEVVQRVGKLFLDAPELTKGFVDFLPDKHAQEVELARLAEMQEQRRKAGTPAGEAKPSRKKPEGTGAGHVSSTVPQKRKRKPADREKDKDKEKGKDVDKDNRQAPSKTKKARTTQPQPTSTVLTAQHNIVGTSSPHHHQHVQTPQMHPHQHLPPAAIPSPIPVAIAPPPPPPQPLGPVDETQFFDRVKRALDNRETFNEFLKLVNLFTQDIIDTARLVRESRSFLGDGELMAQFREILGWDERRDRIAVADDVWTRPMVALDRPSRNQLNLRYGSYRRLPKNEANVICSGRDEMCKSVLNDEWISQPTFASEDTGFHTHKKNTYEEALHRSEEERHEYDFHIEAIGRTIQMLEPISNKIATLSQEDRNSFKLKPNFNGVGKSVHLRVLKKIYGRDAGQEVYQAMQEVPALAIPVVLSRLKTKQEEWKRAQREWNKVWREVDARNYHRSLDHQGITFKAADKKAITAKFFVNQIEAARDEQVAKRAALIDPLFARTRPRHQLEFVIDDMSVMQDVLKLAFAYLDRIQSLPTDRRKIEHFLRSFPCQFFMQDPAVFAAAFVPHYETFDNEADADGISDDASGRVSGRSRKAGPSGSGDLRKKLLKSEQAKSSRRTRAQGTTSASTSRMASPAPSDVMALDTEEGQPQSVQSSASAGPEATVSSDATANAGTNAINVSPGEKQPTRKRYSFFTNTTFYVFFRLLELLYSRLRHFKNLAATISKEPGAAYKLNPAIIDPNLVHNAGQADDRAATAVHFYSLILVSCERLFDNDIEQHVFEDQMRYMFGTKDAYKIFTVDKVVGAIIKQAQHVISDVNSQELFELLRREREIASPTTQDQINARRNTERVIGPDENLFRMDWLPESKTVTIQLIGKEDSSFDDPEVLSGRWEAYVESFVKDEHTKGVTASMAKKRPFLRRTLHKSSADDSSPDAVANGRLEIKVCVRTYRLFFVSHTEDFLWRIVGREEREDVQKKLQAKDASRRQWLDKFVADLSDKTAASSGSKESPADLTESKSTSEIDRAKARSGQATSPTDAAMAA